MYMRKINTHSFQVATRTTSRDVNRLIALNLIREHQPISRAELSRKMGLRRSVLSMLVGELVAAGSVDEIGTAPTVRGRRPRLLVVRTSGRLAAAVDVRSSHTVVALVDFAGQVLARDVVATPSEPGALVDVLSERITRLIAAHAADQGALGTCHGVGLVVPGMVDRRTGRVIYAPRLGWRDVDLRATLEDRLALPVHVESAPIACALARLWLTPEEPGLGHSFAYVSVSDGVGVGLVVGGEALRGEAHTAGEFGHVPLDPNGPECVCGRRGCWEALACNAAIVGYYTERALGEAPATPVVAGSAKRPGAITVEDVVRRARRGEEAAIGALTEAGRQIGRGLAAVVSAFNPGRIFVGGEVTAGWEWLEGPIREQLVGGTLTASTRATPVIPDRAPAEYRLRGAVALVAAPTFAAPRVG